MKNTLRNKLIVTGALLTSLGFGSGCAGLGAVYMQSDDPLTRATGTIMHYEGMHQDRMEESAAGRSEVNVNYGNRINDSLSEICSKKLGFFITDGDTLYRKCEDGIWRTIYDNQIFTATDQDIEKWSRNTGRSVYFGEKKEKIRSIKSPFFTYTKFVDINKNGMPERNEFFGVGKNVYKIGEEIDIFYGALNNEREITFSILDSEGKKGIEITERISEDKINRTAFSRSFIAEKNAPLGEYKIVATTDKGETQVIDYKLVK